MPLTPGTRLGPYEIVGPLGAGGMGEVHRARDTRLGREVAIKVLTSRLASNPELRARFEREAKTISSLNHPHICTLFDVGRAPGEAGSGDTDFLVMELVEGDSLAERLAKGPLPAAEVLRLGAQIADALDRAHRAGVVHRDLKPGNIMLTRSGAKLMDFGLARATGLVGAASGSAATLAALTHSPTRAQALTAEGTLVGTFQYMPPEQLEGKEVDGRGDLWALGCVLYEMTTGRRAFEGQSQASLISSIMKDEPPPLSQVAPMSPPALDRLVRQCLAKNPDDRWQSAGDVKRELEWIAGGAQSGSTPGAAAVRPRASSAPAAGRIAIVAWAVVVLAAMAYWLGPWKSNRVGATSLVRFALNAPPGITLGGPAEAELSPDGLSIVFVAADSTGTSRLYLRPLASPESRVLPGTEDARTPFWSPDGRTIGFFSSAKLRKVALDGSPPVALCDAPDARGGSWSPRGVIAFVPTNAGPVWRVSASGGAAVQVTRLNPKLGERGHRYPQFLPGGGHFLYVAIGESDEQSTFAVPIEGGDPVEVCRASSGARFAPPGHLLFLEGGVNASQRRLLARRFDPGTLKAHGDAVLVLDNVNATNFGYANVSASTSGALVVQHWGQPHLKLTWRDRRGAAAGTAVEDLEGGAALAVSPDGLRLTCDGSDGKDLSLLEFESGVRTRLTFENTTVNSPIWSPDGRRIVFGRLSGSRGWQIRVKAADGSSPESLVFAGPAMLNYQLDWSRDGRWLIARCADTTGNFDLWKIPMDGSGSPEPYQRTAALEDAASLSPDGRWLAYSATEHAVRATYVQSFPIPGAKYEVTQKNPGGAVWSERGDALLAFSQDNEISSIAVSTEGGFRQGATTKLFRVPPKEFLVDVTRDHQRFLVGEFKDLRSLSELEVVLNWGQLLAKR